MLTTYPSTLVQPVNRVVRSIEPVVYDPDKDEEISSGNGRPQFGVKGGSHC
jgi:hypothetical protein